MYLEISARQTFKTTRLLESVKKINSNKKVYIFALNESEVSRIIKLIEKLDKSQLAHLNITVITLDHFCESDFTYMRGFSWEAEYYFDEFAWSNPYLFKQFFIKYLSQGLNLDNIHLYTTANNTIDLQKLQDIKHAALLNIIQPLHLALILNDFKYYSATNAIDLTKSKMYNKNHFEIEILGNFIK